MNILDTYIENKPAGTGNYTSKPYTSPQKTKTPETEKTDYKKLAIGLAAATAIAVAGIAICKTKSAKSAQEAFKALSDIKFDKGSAYLKDGKKFTGVIKDTLKNGDSITMEYADGVLKKSARKGVKSFEKVYETVNNEKIVKITQNGITSEKNITQIKNEVQKHQAEFAALMRNKEASVEELKAFDPKNLSSKQELELKSRITKQMEADLKKREAEMAAEKAVREAQEKAAREAQEKAAREAQEKAAKEAREKAIKEAEAKAAKRAAEYTPKNLDLNGVDKPKLEEAYDCPWVFSYKKTEGAVEKGMILSKDSQDYKFYQECKNLNLDSDVNLFDGINERTFDIPEKFAIMADNSLKQKGNACICDEIPKIFEGIDEKEVMNKLNSFARMDKSGHKAFSFEAGGKKINASYVGGGEVGSVFRLTDESGNSAAMKIYGSSRGSSLNLNSGTVEIATSRQLGKDKVRDVPKFYMANAGLTIPGENGKVYSDTPWMLSEFIDEKTPVKEGGKKLLDWLKEHNMYYSDALKNGRTEGGYLLDVGGMVSENCEASREWMRDDGAVSYLGVNQLLERAIKVGMGVEDILKVFK